MKLPIGIQTFSEIRKHGYLYVDKTEHIHRVVTSGKYYFLSRPRRFGKSVLISTLGALYEGRKDLFEGLWIENNWDWEKSYTVLHFKFSSQGIRTLGAEQAIYSMLADEADRLNIQLEKESYDLQFKELIKKASARGRVVVLIDEYDKPIIDYLEDVEQAKTNRQLLKNFYAVIKDSDPFLELVFITGVSRFAKTSIFSELNNLTNLTLHRNASTLLGITEKELEYNFSDFFGSISEESGMSIEELRSSIKKWYNGYSWNGIDQVYNPFSLLSFFGARSFDNFWFETGTPTFLINALHKEKFYRFEKIKATDSILDSYEIENINPITLLFQTGYLTIRMPPKSGIYVLDYPNYEVKYSLEEHLINAFSHDQFATGKLKALELVEALQSEDIKQFVNIINATFSTIPNQLWQKDNEAFYHAIIHLLCSLMGAFIQSEVNSAQGRLDAMVESKDTIYILEFKLDKTAEEALAQISTKGYFKPYLGSPKRKIGIGINFSKAKKEIDSWLVKDFTAMQVFDV